MFDRFTASARELVVAAQEQCRAGGAASIGSHHFLAAALAREDDPTVEVLRDAGIDDRTIAPYLEPASALYPGDSEALASIGIAVEEIERRVDETFGEGALRRGPTTPGFVPFEHEAKAGLEAALRVAVELGMTEITPGHVLLGMLHEGSRAARIITELGGDPDALRRQLQDILRRPGGDASDAA